MGVRDKLAHNRLAKLWLPVNTFMGVETLDLGSASTTGLQLSLSEGNSTVQKSGQLLGEFVTMQCAEADEIHTVLPIPWDLDRDKKVLGRIFFYHEAAAADTGIIWKIYSKFLGKQEAMVEIQGSKDTVTTCTAHTASATADSTEVTAWNDLSWNKYMTPTDILACLAVEFDTNGDAEDDECNFLGLELCYETHAYEDSTKFTNVDDELLNNSYY